MKDIMYAPFVEEMRNTTANMYRLGWDERNGGNISYMLDEAEVAEYLDLDKVIRYFKREGIQFLVQTSTALYCEHDFLNTVIPGLIDAGCSKELVEKTFVNIVTIDDIRNAPDIEKFSFYLSPHNPKKISEDLDDDFYVVDFSLGKINAPLFFGEMNMAGVNKATAIEKFMAHVGAPMSDSIAFGDSGNDFEMMQAVGFAVAMGNATEPIKALADYVTTDVDKDGIYNAFVHLGLI